MPLQLDIVTPEKKVFSHQVDYVYLPGAEGELGILPHHIGLVTAMEPGELRFEYGGDTVVMAVGSGFARIGAHQVTILTDMAVGESEIDEEAAEAAVRRAQEKLKHLSGQSDQDEMAYLEGVISKSTVALSVKRKYRP